MTRLQLATGTAVPLAALILSVGGCGGSNSPSSHEVVLGSADTTVPAPTSPGTPGRKAPLRKSASAREATGPARPAIKQWPIPFSAARRQETAAYSARHYGSAETRLDPKVIVEHYTVTPTAQATFDIFAKDVPDVELRELPGLCSHFIVDRDGTIYQLVPVSMICRHTVGLNDVAIGIEHVGSSDQEVLGTPAQLSASLRLTTWLRCRYGIAVKDVIGHNESLSSPYHHEKVGSLRAQTHADFQKASMDLYRGDLSKTSC
jgi:N-acetylmuramoyl-L-alanine amidase